ncbi:hypothetical protein AB5J52_10710 [Streptomyces sp. R39]|uniref:Uncharacterized protein n=1 Tax=Streptomyces sp. R39 TaxID=3238631 RepID=A0AB39QJ62_9ACTN
MIRTTANRWNLRTDGRNAFAADHAPRIRPARLGGRGNAAGRMAVLDLPAVRERRQPPGDQNLSDGTDGRLKPPAMAL